MPCSSHVWYEKEFTLTIEKEGGTEGTGWLVVNTNGRFRGILFVHASSFWHKDSMQFIILESVLSKRKVLSFCLRPFSHRSTMIVLTEYLPGPQVLSKIPSESWKEKQQTHLYLLSPQHMALLYHYCIFNSWIVLALLWFH